MSNDIRIAVGFWTHHKTVKLERRLGPIGVKSLLVLWTWTAQHRPHGALDGMDAEDIEIAAMWSGEPGALVKSLSDLAWLDHDGNTYSIHGWSEHQPWIVGSDARKEKAKKAISARWEKDRNNKEKYSENTTSIPGVIPSSSPCLSLGLKSSPSDNVGEVDQSCTHMVTPDGATAHVDPDPTPVPAPEKPKRTKKAAKAAPEYTASFLAFWEAYPRKVGKAAAFEAWQAVGARMKAEGKDARGILAAIKAQVAAGHLGVDLQHIPHPTTWLNQSRWEDEIAPAGTLPATRGQPPGTYGGLRLQTVRDGKLVVQDQMAKAVLAQRAKENADANGTDAGNGPGGPGGPGPALPEQRAHP